MGSFRRTAQFVVVTVFVMVPTAPVTATTVRWTFDVDPNDPRR